MLTLLLAFFLWPWGQHTTVPIVADSVVRIEIQGVDAEGEIYKGSCSGFVVAVERVLTAAHCAGITLTADLEAATPVWQDDYFDLLLLEVKDLRKPVLRIRETPAVFDESLTAYGFGYGWRKLTILKERVMLVANAVVEGAPVGVIVQGGFIGGMSGGPIVDKDGQVVAIVQRGNQQIGYGVGIQFIRAFLYDAENR